MKSFLCFCVAVPSQPTDFKGEAKSETSIVLSWIAPAQTGQENQITGYELVYRKRDDTEEVFSPILKNNLHLSLRFVTPPPKGRQKVGQYG